MFIKVIKYLRNLILNKRKKEIKTNDIVVIDEKASDLPELHSCENININWEVISQLSNYDIVLIEFPNSNNSKESYKKRPFLITRLNHGCQTVTGYPFTSNIQNCHFNNNSEKYLKLVLDKNKYSINKNSLVDYKNETELSYKNIIHKLDRLSIKDLSRLKKFKSLSDNNKAFSCKEDCLIEIGDVILENNSLYIIYQKDNTYSYGYSTEKLSNNYKIDIDNNFNYIVYNNNIYFVDFSKNKIFNNYDDLLIVDIFSLDMINVIRENKKQLKIAMKVKKH